VDPEPVTRNEKGEAETVRYDAVNARLLNELLKERRPYRTRTQPLGTSKAKLRHLLF
jgi:hypothetical protein